MPQKEMKYCLECGKEIDYEYFMVLDNHIQFHVLNEPEIDYAFCSEDCVLRHLSVERILIDGSDY